MLKDSNITVEMVEEFVTVDFRTGTEITLFFNSPVKNGRFERQTLPAFSLDGNHYKVVLPDTKRAGNYPIDVYAGDDNRENTN